MEGKATVARSSALARALDLARRGVAATTESTSDRRLRRFHVALGDCHANLERVLSILDQAGLLAASGWLRGDVHLVTMGDYFDFGPFEDRVGAGEDGTALLAWFAAHSVDQVTILLGNHDLARVGELVGYDDDRFQRAALTAYGIERGRDHRARGDIADPHQQFLDQHPALPSLAHATRHYACYRAKQREVMTRLLRQRRCVVAYAHDDALLCTHAGVTRSDVRTLGAGARLGALAVAAGLNEALFDAVAKWRAETPLEIAGLHRVGSATKGPTGGIFSHRACNPDALDRTVWREGKRARRLYDARDLPEFRQVCGHMRDRECIERFGPWSRVTRARAGVLRGFAIRNGCPCYEHGAASDAQIYFVDGEMGQGNARYELLDLERRTTWHASEALVAS